MESNETNGEIFHVGDMRDEIKIAELVKYIGELVGYDGDYEPMAAPSGSISRRCPDTTKISMLLGYQPSVNWREGVKRTVEWYLDYLNSGGDVYE